MEPSVSRAFTFDGDVLEVPYRYEPALDKFLGEYPDFTETPRYTPKGRPWVGAVQDGCDHGENRFCHLAPCDDCGSCRYFVQEKPHDLIGVCDHAEKRQRRAHPGAPAAAR